MELEEVRGPSGGDRLAVGVDVVGGDDETPVVDLDAQQAVVEDVAAVGARGERGAAFGDGGLRAAGRDAGARVRGRVEDERGRAFPANARWAASMIPFSSPASRSYVARASRWTQAMEEPGRMSWNWCSRTVFQMRSNSSYG